jgi:hypothetical protein
MSASRVPVTVAVEGPTDQAVVRRLLQALEISCGPVHICNGKGKLDRRVSAYNHAARHAPWLVLRDLDRDFPCAPSLIAEILPSPSSRMFFRIVVRAVESWLLADGDAMASFLGVGAQSLPPAPDELSNPRATLLELARKARRRDVREDLLPSPGVTALVGRGYTARLIEFADRYWRPETAAERSPSLAGCIRSLHRLR